MTLGLDTTTIPFGLRGIDGEVSVDYGANEDPVRWGYDVLDLDWFTPDLVRGFPVMQASVKHPAEGYAADMGWLQVVRYDVRDAGAEEHQVVFDVPPQLSETESPYAAFGVRPTFFDAPAAGAKDMTWAADTFLAYSPHAVLSRVIRPLCGFSWGYRISNGVVQLSPLSIAGPEEWERDLPDLRGRYPTWSFESWGLQ